MSISVSLPKFIDMRNRAVAAEGERDELQAHLERRDEFLDAIYRRLGGEPDRSVATVDYPIVERIDDIERLRALDDGAELIVDSDLVAHNEARDFDKRDGDD